MCGICGIIRFDGSKVNKVKAQGMLKSLARRGPDNQDSYEKDMIYLGHRRLSIIDISSKSNQPFIDASNKNVIVFNGVIYNYKKIRQRLISYGYKFSSDGDTEVILKSYEHYGKDCIKQLDGVFAFCIYDIERKQFFLARDRLGIKPLYYKYDNNSFSFSSNTEALIDKNNIEIDEASLHYQFTLHSVIPAPRTILKNIKKLEPGHILIVDSNGKQKKENYYSFEHISINKGLTKPAVVSEIDGVVSYGKIKRGNREIITPFYKEKVLYS